MLNTHPSLLPKYKGLHTHQRAIEAKDLHGGCSVHIVTAELDGGPVLGQVPVHILADDTPSGAQGWFMNTRREKFKDPRVREALERKERVMGFGHRVYKAVDPRATVLRELADAIMQGKGETRWLDLSDRVRAAMGTEMEQRGKKIYPNVDFFSASVYYTIGIPTDLFTNVFAMARAAGWTAHVIEQLADNRLIRPKAEYKGPMGRKVRPIAERG